MLFLKVFSLLVMFLLGSWGSGKLLNLYGYPVPRSLKNRNDWILFAMKLILFMILVILQLVILMLLGFHPFDIGR